MSKAAFDLSRQTQALLPIHTSIRSICESVGIDVVAAEDFAQKNNLPLPWNESVSPENVLKSARELLKRPPQVGLDSMEVIDNFITSVTLSNVPVGLLGALAAVGNQFWDGPAKVGFLTHFPLEAYVDFSLPSDEQIDRGEYAVHPDGMRGALCWLVHDILAAGALQNTPLSKESSEVIDILVRYAVVTLVDCAHSSARSGGSSFNLIGELETTLSNLGKYYAETKPRVAQLYKVLIEECEAVSDRQDPELRLHENLLRLYPDPFLELNLSGVRISQESSAMTEAYRATMTLTNFLRDPITSQPEWAHPLEVAAEEIKTKDLVRLVFCGSDLLTSRKAREVLFDLLDKAPGVTLAISADHFFTPGATDPSYKDLVDSLNHFIKTNVESHLTLRTSEPDFEAKKQSTVDFLRAAVTKLGHKNVLVVSPSDTKSFKPAKGSHTCLIASTLEGEVTDTQGKVTVDLNKREPENGAVVRLRESLNNEMPRAIIVGGILSSIRSSVVPTLAQQDLPRDKHGLNGLRPTEIAVRLSQVTLEGVGPFPTLTHEDFARPSLGLGSGLAIMYTGQHEEVEEELSMDSEDAPRHDEGAGTGNLVGSKRA